ncbi:MAG TPA: neutral/alkaline non-lysosomal ceramidase N-terminal domain-containing protein [Candidatus Hydrogenedentes bacterium]|nr:neutral/alkaline non-lysosomal ceramidase N-terminal domain-containing protein [Candidatus Hydrogenedentota bacterium]HQM50731.1 neutral/alkaline non-lysosomal ceramidase N-terminal domain-containing protein [Candidatus Hydrogenedentota bacterium]
MNSLKLNSVMQFGLGLLAAACLFAMAGNAAETEAPVLRAGAAKANITPPLGCDIVGNFEVPKATHIHDDLHVRCLVLDNGERRLAIVICDNLGIDQNVFDEAKKRLQEITGIPPEHLFMASTHTHSGPPARVSKCPGVYGELTQYQRFLADRIVDGVQCAINNLEPAQVGWGKGEEPDQVFNRRWYMSDPALMVSPYGAQDQVRMNPPGGHASLVKPAGPTDPGIVFLAVRSVEGRPIALLANYSLHYVGGVPGGHISADYYGVFTDRIQDLLGADRLEPPFVGILSNGTSGDVNNINHSQPRPKREPYDQMYRVANIVAAEVFRAYQTIEFKDQVKLGGRLTKLTLGLRKPDEAQVQWANDILGKPEAEVGIVKRSYAQRTLNLRECPDTVDIWVQALRIGDLGIAGIPFETFAETGLRIKAESPLPVTFTISQANGGFGYLPTPAQHALGGYETWLGTSKVAVDSEPTIVSTLFQQLAELAAE